MHYIVQMNIFYKQVPDADVNLSAIRIVAAVVCNVAEGVSVCSRFNLVDILDEIQVRLKHLPSPPRENAFQLLDFNSRYHLNI